MPLGVKAPEMITVDQIFHARKAWLLRFHRERGWGVAKIRNWFRERHGNDIDPKSLRAYLKGFVTERRTPARQGKKRIRNRTSVSTRNLQKQLDHAERKVERAGDFNPKSKKDAREKALQAIVRRRGQHRFRTELLLAYGHRCPITKCDLPEALEAAHIQAYRGEKFNHVQNGILLRGDIHTLFDLGKIGVHPDTHKIVISGALRGTVYEKLEKEKFLQPTHPKDRPNSEVLRFHLKEWNLGK